MAMAVFLVLITACILSGFLGSWVSIQNNRPSEEGFLLGLLLGPFGCLLAALLPVLSDEDRDQLIASRQANVNKWFDPGPIQNKPSNAPPTSTRATQQAK